MINQFAGVHCGQTWAQHIANGISDHGDDFSFGNGSRIIAPFSGTVRNHARAESPPYKALYIMTIQSDQHPEVQMEYMHLSSFANEGHYNEGDVIGHSGGLHYALGSGAASGPHIHVNSIINGVVRPYTDAFSYFQSVGPLTIITPAPTTKRKRRKMDIVFWRNSKGDISAVFQTPNGLKRGIITPAHWGELTAAGCFYIQVGDGDYAAVPVSV